MGRREHPWPTSTTAPTPTRAPPGSRPRPRPCAAASSWCCRPTPSTAIGADAFTPRRSPRCSPPRAAAATCRCRCWSARRRRSTALVVELPAVGRDAGARRSGPGALTLVVRHAPSLAWDLGDDPRHRRGADADDDRRPRAARRPARGGVQRQPHRARRPRPTRAGGRASSSATRSAVVPRRRAAAAASVDDRRLHRRGRRGAAGRRVPVERLRDVVPEIAGARAPDREPHDRQAGEYRASVLARLVAAAVTLPAHAAGPPGRHAHRAREPRCATATCHAVPIPRTSAALAMLGGLRGGLLVVAARCRSSGQRRRVARTSDDAQLRCSSPAALICAARRARRPLRASTR